MKNTLRRFLASKGLVIKRIDQNIPLNVNLHYLHVGKTGGSELRKRFNIINDSGQFLILTRSHDITITDLPSDANYVISLRDPVKRFVSAYFSLKNIQNRKHSLTEKEFFTDFPDINDLAIALGASNKNNDLALRYMLSIRHLAQRQSAFVNYIDIRQRPPAHIFRTETLDKDFKVFCEKYNLVDYKNIGGYENASSPTNSESSLDPRLYKYIKQWYIDDYFLWKYL